MGVRDQLFRDGGRVVYVPNFSMKGKDFDGIRYNRLKEKEQSTGLTEEESNALAKLERFVEPVDVDEF